MDWRESLEPTIPRLAITVLLVSYCIFTIPVVNMHSTLCKEEGVDCSLTDYRVSVYYCLKINFRQEFYTPSMYAVRDCDRKDLLWLFFLVPFLYLISAPLYEQIMMSVEAWRYGSRKELITWSLLILTLLPGFFFGVFESGSPDPFLYGYLFYPLGLLYTCVNMLSSGEMVFPVFAAIFLAVTVFGASRFFREEDMDYPRVYTFWVFYVVTAFLGVLVM
ncbi:MAG: hypothetical protein HXS44_02745 [Theionarchaea archaeon]|nr:hypothetical protein [Theionarchaea archaeon]